jgi:hypothetical protein
LFLSTKELTNLISGSFIGNEKFLIGLLHPHAQLLPMGLNGKNQSV